VERNSGTIFEDKNITVNASSQSGLSFLRLWYDATNKRIYPFLTAIIDVKDGTVTGITWDDACVFCGGFGDSCDEDTYDFDGNPVDEDEAGQVTKGCWIKQDDCKGNPSKCDLQLYVVWTGTDSGGKAMQSQASRFSLFPAQELGDRISQIVPTFGLDRRRELKEIDHPYELMVNTQGE
jgi:hypothetical protein